MYQAQKDIGQTEENFKELNMIFNNQIFNLSNEKKDTTEWDLDIEYKVNHVAIWNKPNTVNCNVKIIQKNDKLALVEFSKEYIVENDILTLANVLFRLEDLTPIKS